MAEEVKVSKAGVKRVLGRRLAARVLKTWIEDFVDEDTGEVVSIERNELVLDRDTVLEKEHIELIVESGSKTIILHKEDINQADYAIIHNTLQKDPSNSEKEAVEYIYRQLRNAEPPDIDTARGVIDKLFFSEQRYDLGEVGVSASTGSSESTCPKSPHVDQGRHHPHHQVPHRPGELEV